MAPVLPFTADEVWPLIPGPAATGTVHAARFPPREPADAAILRRFEALMEARAVVTKALEEARATKQIAASLESSVTLRGNAKVLSALREHDAKGYVFPGNLANLFIVSEVVLLEDEGDLRVEVRRAEGAKCERCWTFSRRAAGNSPALCERCSDVLAAGA
jgi:isoleucyl-tRNA synthetase